MQAIQTIYKGPTNSRGSRILAKCEGGRRVIPFDHAANARKNHRLVALALAAKLGWYWQPQYMLSGTLPDGSMCHVYDHIQVSDDQKALGRALLATLRK